MVTLIGPQLRSAREQLGLTLEDAAHETRIPQQRLEWLEEDNYAAFGSLTYARAFIKIYSAFLGINAQSLLEEIPSTRLRGPHAYRYLTENYGPWVNAQNRLRQTVVRGGGGRSPVMAGIGIFLLMLIGTGVWGNHVARQRQAGNMQAVATHEVKLSTPARTPKTAFSSGVLLPGKQKQIFHKRVADAAAAAFDAGMSAGMD
ncbi:helix-turn-helix protein [Prosthecobacter fusiformis]|uniref:Helix-turn-helix protein n=1 Tax=Prosthecobacter fusiformis TaxID=48464 RepID=A0A4R7RJZ1_9BACT|nr:helix-turn-helix domain-containing protein [Prosthecobacter fusiformis]TDU63226.1 helix-turn-helix protein [Prosthecobacter fusiformis]